MRFIKRCLFIENNIHLHRWNDDQNYKTENIKKSHRFRAQYPFKRSRALIYLCWAQVFLKYCIFPKMSLFGREKPFNKGFFDIINIKKRSSFYEGPVWSIGQRPESITQRSVFGDCRLYTVSARLLIQVPLAT